MDGRLFELLAVFAGGALPWLEAIVVIPIGIAAGLPPVAVVIAGATGNLATIAVAAEDASVVAISFGYSARRSFTWIAAGTVLWCIVVAIMASLGLPIAGVGAT